MLKKLQASEILATAIGMVGSASSSVRMTMNANEELQNRIPQEYFTLLLKKMHDGVKVIRIGFGSKNEFELLATQVYVESPNYTFLRTNTVDYRRMLLVDNKKLLFTKTSGSEKYVFYSEDSGTVASYLKYFDHQMQLAQN